MEREFKIKTKSKPNVMNQYPSERRYSSSIVLGLGVVFFQLCVCSILMGGLIIYNMVTLRKLEDDVLNSQERLSAKLERDIQFSDRTYFHYYINVPVLVSVGCFLMAAGQIIGLCTGLFAWKRWYIDNNITFFFLACVLSTITSSISLLISLLTSFFVKFDRYDDYDETKTDFFPISLPLAVNIIVLSCGSVVWSFLSSKIAYRGMRNSYPDDMTTKENKTEVAEYKHNHCSVSSIPVEVLNSFAVGAMIKYFPKNDVDDLPKIENKEVGYVNKAIDIVEEGKRE